MKYPIYKKNSVFNEWDKILSNEELLSVRNDGKNVIMIGKTFSKTNVGRSMRFNIATEKEFNKNFNEVKEKLNL